MRIYLAGGESYYRNIIQSKAAELRASGLKINQLVSFYSYLRRKGNLCINADRLMIDSGAFSFIRKGTHANLEEYIPQYIEFITDLKADFYFELDIDGLIGYDKVKEIRRRLEREVGKRPIVVWHRRLGKEEFFRLCDEYDYIAIGGLAIREILVSEYKYLPYFIEEAHKRNTKIHRLGFTHSGWIDSCHFDSVDSSAWTYGLRAGQVYFFDETKGCCKYMRTPKGYLARGDTVPIHNFIEWVKFGAYAERNL